MLPYNKCQNYLNKLLNTSSNDIKFKLYLYKLNYWYSQIGSALGESVNTSNSDSKDKTKTETIYVVFSSYTEMAASEYHPASVKIYNNYFSELIKKYNITSFTQNTPFINVPGDGSCFLHAVLVSLCYKIGICKFIKNMKMSCKILKLQMDENIYNKSYFSNIDTLHNKIYNYFTGNITWFKTIYVPEILKYIESNWVQDSPYRSFCDGNALIGPILNFIAYLFNVNITRYTVWDKQNTKNPYYINNILPKIYPPDNVQINIPIFYNNHLKNLHIFSFDGCHYRAICVK